MLHSLAAHLNFDGIVPILGELINGLKSHSSKLTILTARIDNKPKHDQKNNYKIFFKLLIKKQILKTLMTQIDFLAMSSLIFSPYEPASLE